MKIFDTTEIVTIRLCQYFLGIIPLDYQLDIMKLKFQLRLNKQNGLFRSGVNHIFIHDIKECASLMIKYGITNRDSSKTVSHKCFMHFTEFLRTNGHLD